MKILIRAIKRWWNTDPATHGAALAYYAIFSLAPLFIILVVALGRVFGRQAVEGKIIQALQNVMGQDVSSLIQTLIAYAAEPVTGLLAASLSVILTVVGALALFSQVERALAAMWHEDADKAVATTFLKTKILAVGMIVVLGLLIILSFVLSGIASFITIKFGSSYAAVSVILSTLSTMIALGYIVVLFILMYKYLPGKFVSWKAAIFGGVVGGILFILGRYLLALYVTNTVVFSTYGAAGAMLLILIWFYYSAQIFFFGGALCYAIDETDTLRQTSL